jgi:fimbrial isopeptide formation D2 family protein/uncharacterized repeat protein (TIGR02543 family)
MDEKRRILAFLLMLALLLGTIQVPVNGEEKNVIEEGEEETMPLLIEEAEKITSVEEQPDESETENVETDDLARETLEEEDSEAKSDETLLENQIVDNAGMNYEGVSLEEGLETEPDMQTLKTINMEESSLEEDSEKNQGKTVDSLEEDEASWEESIDKLEISISENQEEKILLDSENNEEIKIDDEVYALFFSNGELVFQRGEALSEGQEMPLQIYKGFESTLYNNNASIPWYEKRNMITSVRFEDDIQPEYTQYWFSNCSKLTTVDAAALDLSNTKNMSFMFQNCKSLKSLNVSNWNTGKVTYMQSIFSGCDALENLEISNWDTSSVKYMQSMFYNCKSLTSLDLSNWDTSSVTNMQSMFYGCRNLNVLDVSNWNTGKVTSMLSMFYNCESLLKLDVSNWNTASATNLSNMFYGCSQLMKLDISGWSTGKATNLSAMFQGCKSLNRLDLSGWSTGKVSNMQSLFYGCTALTSVDLRGWDARAVKSMNNLFSRCTSLACLMLGENFRITGNSIDLCDGPWLRESTKEILTTAEVYELYNGTGVEDSFYRTQPITFYGNGGQPAESIQEYAMGQQIQNPLEVSRTGYQFEGWYTEPEGGTALDVITQTTYYAHWKENTYTLILKPNGGVHTEEGTSDAVVLEIGCEEAYQLPGNLFSRKGMRLLGWNTRVGGNGTAYGADEEIYRLSEENGACIILYAQWTREEASTVRISFDSAGGIELSSVTVPAGGTLETLPIPLRDGYTFLSWHEQTIDGPEVTAESKFTKETLLVALWAENPVVTFSLNGNGEEIQRRVPYASAIGSFPEVTSQDGRLLTGWYTEAEGGSVVTEDTILTENVTVYAHWGWRPVFLGEGGVVKEGRWTEAFQDNPRYQIQTLPVAVRDGYVFTGWFRTDGVTLVSLNDTVDLSDALGNQILAHWEPMQTAHVTLDPGEGSLNGISVMEVLAGTQAEGLPIPQREGFLFGGWKMEDGEVCGKETIFTKDCILTALWKQKTYKVTFDAQGGTGLTKDYEEIADGDTIQILPGASKENSILEGWYTKPEGLGEKLTADTVIQKDSTYYANWVPFLKTETRGNLTYVYGAQWSNVSEESSVDNVGGTLQFHPTSRSLQTASLHVRFEVNKLGEEDYLPAGSVKIQIPMYIWENWQGMPTGTVNLDTQLPKYPDARDGMYFSYAEDEENGNYILINNQELIGGTGVDVTISYQVSPWNVPGGAFDETGRYLEEYPYFKGSVPVVFQVDQNLDGEAEICEKQELFVEMHTKVTASSSKSVVSVSYQWDNAWGKKPEQSENYFYVTWRLLESFGAETCQPLTYEWKECTVHDGTVITDLHQYTVKETDADSVAYHYVVTAHPMSLLAEASKEGLTLHNEALVVENWQSGYQTSRRVYAETVVYPTEYPTGLFVKDNGSSYAKKIQGGQETLVDDQQEVSLSWRMSYEGGASTQPLWEEASDTYRVGERTIRIRDGDDGDVLYSSGISASTKYLWEPSSGNTALTDADYSFTSLSIRLYEYDAFCRNGAWTEPLLHERPEDYGGVEVWIRPKNSTEFVFYTMSYVSETFIEEVSLPKDTAGFELRHNSSFYTTKITVSTWASLKPSSRVRALIQADIGKNTTSLLKNRAVCDVWEKGEEKAFFHACNGENGQASADQVIYELNISSTNQYTRARIAGEKNVCIDAQNGVQEDPVCVSAWNYNASGREKQIRTGVFYNLLPVGTSVDASSVYGVPILESLPGSGRSSSLSNEYESSRARSDRLDRGMYEVQFYEDWEGSGRTMMTISFVMPETCKAQGVDFYYLLHTTYENIVRYGTSEELDVAFVNTTVGRVTPALRSGLITILTQPEYFESIEEQAGEFCSYSVAWTSYAPVEAFSFGFNKTVRTDQEFEQTGRVLPGATYCYRLSYSQSEQTRSRGIVFYDVLESGTGMDDASWYGTFVDLDVVFISEDVSEDMSEGAACAPVIYYSTKNRADFEEADFTVSNTETWSTEKPAADTITAVAVDCSKCADGSDFVLEGQQTVEVYLTMRSSKQAAEEEETLCNEAVVYAVKGTDKSPTAQYSKAEVVRSAAKPEIHKTAFPAQEDPAKACLVTLDEELTYEITVSNPDAACTWKQLVVEDTIPDGLYFQMSSIRVIFGDANVSVKVTDSPRIDVKRNGQTITFTIHTLLPGEQVTLLIPTNVNLKEAIFENTASLTWPGMEDEPVYSETTLHQAVLKEEDPEQEPPILIPTGVETNSRIFFCMIVLAVLLGILARHKRGR